MWDVAVVGSGPAGAAAALRALQLRPQADVLLIDRAVFPRDKACGDGIAPHVLDVLAELGVDDALGGHVPVHGLRLRSPRGREVSRIMRRAAFVVPRRVFDARLAAAAAARGAVRARRTVRSITSRAGAVIVDGDIPARVVIGADGANSVVRRTIGLPLNSGAHTALALRGYVAAGRSAHEQFITMTGIVSPAYAWEFPLGDGGANVGYGEVLGDRTTSRRHLRDRMRHLLEPLGDVGGQRAHLLPLTSQRPRQPDGRVLLAGDAASLINPFTGEGIYYAVLSGMLAGQAALDPANPGRIYRRSLQTALRSHLRATGAAARLVRYPAVVDAAVRASHADQRVFDDLVELGLGRGTLTPAVLAGLTRKLIDPRGDRRGRVSDDVAGGAASGDGY